jgi:ABC-2 type transport system ATP-binding protein
VHQGSIGGLMGLGRGAVIVRTPMPERLLAAARHAGGRVELLNGSGRMLIEGMDAAQVGELAHGERVILHELAVQDGSLEQVFFSLTEEVEAA